MLERSAANALVPAGVTGLPAATPVTEVTPASYQPRTASVSVLPEAEGTRDDAVCRAARRARGAAPRARRSPPVEQPLRRGVHDSRGSARAPHRAGAAARTDCGGACARCCRSVSMLGPTTRPRVGVVDAEALRVAHRRQGEVAPCHEPGCHRGQPCPGAGAAASGCGLSSELLEDWPPRRSGTRSRAQLALSLKPPIQRSATTPGAAGSGAAPRRRPGRGGHLFGRVARAPTRELAPEALERVEASRAVVERALAARTRRSTG